VLREEAPPAFAGKSRTTIDTFDEKRKRPTKKKKKRKTGKKGKGTFTLHRKTTTNRKESYSSEQGKSMGHKSRRKKEREKRTSTNQVREQLLPQKIFTTTTRKRETIFQRGAGGTSVRRCLTLELQNKRTGSGKKTLQGEHGKKADASFETEKKVSTSPEPGKETQK